MTMNADVRKNVDISVTGTIGEVDPNGGAKVSASVTGTDGSATYELQLSDDGSDWRTLKSYSSVTSVGDTVDVAARHARLQLTSTGTGTSADTYLAAGD